MRFTFSLKTTYCTITLCIYYCLSGQIQLPDHTQAIYFLYIIHVNYTCSFRSYSRTQLSFSEYCYN